MCMPDCSFALQISSNSRLILAAIRECLWLFFLIFRAFRPPPKTPPTPLAPMIRPSRYASQFLEKFLATGVGWRNDNYYRFSRAVQADGDAGASVNHKPPISSSQGRREFQVASVRRNLNHLGRGLRTLPYQRIFPVEGAVHGQPLSIRLGVRGVVRCLSRNRGSSYWWLMITRMIAC